MDVLVPLRQLLVEGSEYWMNQAQFVSIFSMAAGVPVAMIIDVANMFLAQILQKMRYSVLYQERDKQADRVGYQDISLQLTLIVPGNPMKISEIALVFLFVAEQNPKL